MESNSTTQDIQKSISQYSSFAATNGLQITVIPNSLPSHQIASNSSEKNYFRYDVTITNRDTSRLQIIRRHWIIIDAEGETEEVDGPGVVGEYPFLDVGESYTYQSHCAITTSWGTMEGYYKVRYDNGNTFNAKIARFYLVKNT